MSVPKRVGLIVTAEDSTTEPDFQKVLAPQGITIHSSRMWSGMVAHRLVEPFNTLSNEERMNRINSEIEEATRNVASVDLDAIAYCCTTGSFYKGPGWDREIIDLMEKIAGVPAFATSPSVVEALRALGAKKLSVITPYPEWNNQRLKLYLEAKGFNVLNLDGHPKPASGAVTVPDHDPEEIVEFGVGKCSPEADALLCPCTDWRSLEVVQRLEELIGKPVITANQATIWAVLRKLGTRGPVHGFGRLLEDLSEVAAV